jgi:hypothetical protein
MKRLLFTIIAAATAAMLLPSAASAAPVCTSVNKGGAAANKKIVVSSCRDFYSSFQHREYAVLYIGSASTRAAECHVAISTVEVHPNGAPALWRSGGFYGCNDVLRQNQSVRKWGTITIPYVTQQAKTVACLYLDGHKLGSCVYSPALSY